MQPPEILELCLALYWYCANSAARRHDSSKRHTHDGPRGRANVHCAVKR